jgi:hypothetical protein
MLVFALVGLFVLFSLILVAFPPLRFFTPNTLPHTPEKKQKKKKLSLFLSLSSPPHSLFHPTLTLIFTNFPFSSI